MITPTLTHPLHLCPYCALPDTAWRCLLPQSCPLRLHDEDVGPSAYTDPDGNALVGLGWGLLLAGTWIALGWSLVTVLGAS